MHGEQQTEMIRCVTGKPADCEAPPNGWHYLLAGGMR
jgi:hypothetical protein